MEPTSGIGQVDLSSQVSVQVARKVLDSEQEQGAAFVDMIRQAGSVDAQGGQASDGRLDVYA